VLQIWNVMKIAIQTNYLFIYFIYLFLLRFVQEGKIATLINFRKSNGKMPENLNEIATQQLRLND
jgi:hypothetical protein